LFTDQDATFVYVPVDQTAGMFITTRYSQSYQERCCDDYNIPCDEPWITKNTSTIDGEKYYIPAIENFTIRMSHFFQARDFYLNTQLNRYAQSNAQMKGELRHINGHVLRKFGDDSADIMPLWFVFVQLKSETYISHCIPRK